MSVVVRHLPQNLTREQYDEVSRRMDDGGNWPPDGLDMHVMFGPEGDMRVSEIWDSEEQFRARRQDHAGARRGRGTGIRRARGIRGSRAGKEIGRPAATRQVETFLRPSLRRAAPRFELRRTSRHSRQPSGSATARDGCEQRAFPEARLLP